MSQRLDHNQLASLLRECATIVERNESSALLYKAVEALNSYSEQNKPNGDSHNGNSGLHTNPSSPKQERPCFQRPVNKSSNLIANGWMEQQRRSKLRIVWKEVLVSLVEARRPGEETTLWIQREMCTDDGKACLEALHQIPMKWLLGVKYVDVYGDFRVALRIHEVPDEFVFRAKDEDSCKEWVATLKSARQASISNTNKENVTKFPDLLSKDEVKIGQSNGFFPDLDMQTGAPASASGGSGSGSVSPTSSPPVSAPPPIPEQKKERKTIKELRAIAHGAGYNTRGMERSDLEKIAAYYAPVSEQKARQQKATGTAQAGKIHTPPSTGTIYQNNTGNGPSDIDSDRERLVKAQEAERMKKQKEEEERQRVQKQREYIQQKREEEQQRQQAATAAAAAKKAAEEREKERLRQQQHAQQQQWNSGHQWNNSHHQHHPNPSNGVEQMFESTRFFEGGNGGGIGGIGGPRRKQPEPPVRPSAPPMPNPQQQQQYHQNHYQQQQQQQQQHQRYHPYQQQPPPPPPKHQSHPPTNSSASNPPPPQPQSPPRNPQFNPRASDPTSPLNQKYAKAMSAQKLETENSSDQNEAAIALIKRNILIHWALVPPQYNMLRPIDELLINIQTVFPPFGNVAHHEYFDKWKVMKKEDLVLSFAMGGAPDETKLKKGHRKLRVFLHPDRLPREFDAKQTFVCKMLWDVSNDAWEEFLKQKDDLDWVHQS